MEKEELEWNLNVLQNTNNKLYEEYGATDEIIELQVAINKLRNKFDITDKSEQINNTFVQ